MVAFLALVAFLPSLAPAARASQPGGPPVVSNERPMRYVLTSGTVVVGTRIGEDAEFYTLQTSAGPVRIRKADIQYMDFNTSGGATPPGGPAVGVSPQPGPAPQPAPAPYPRRRSRAGLGLTIAGAITFGTSYFMTLMIGAIASIFNPDAAWMMVPVAGPMIFYVAGDLDRQSFGVLLLSTIVQSAGLVLLIAGGVWSSSSDDDEAARPFQIAEGIDLLPAVTPEHQGLVLSTAF